MVVDDGRVPLVKEAADAPKYKVEHFGSGPLSPSPPLKLHSENVQHLIYAHLSDN
jgi:hypothetical protein